MLSFLFISMKDQNTSLKDEIKVSLNENIELKAILQERDEKIGLIETQLS